MKRDTRLVRSGRTPLPAEGPVNPPVVRASTVLYPSVDEMRRTRARREGGERVFSYGARGTPTAFALEDALCELEDGDRAFLYPTGLAAIAAVLQCFSKAGDHVAVVDTVYPPVRRLCDEHLARRGVDVSYYAPDVDGLTNALRSNTTLIYAESPGSNTFEVLDVPALGEIGRKRGAVLAVDNSWAAGYFHQPLRLGADVSIQAVTKYIGGHSDVMLGAAIARGPVWRALEQASTTLGLCASPDDCYLALRGLRTLAVRLKHHQESGLRIARWLAGRPEVRCVLHPALHGHPGHEVWKRDFTGASGLLSVGLRDGLSARADRLIDALELFGIGSSWGGYESLVLPVDPVPDRTARPWTGPRPLIRLHAGLEDSDDLIADLEQALGRLGSD